MNKITVTNKSQHLTVTSTPKNRILINNRTGGAGGGAETIIQLKDVDATHLANNETLVYNEVSGKFVVETIPVISGGEF